MTIAQQVWMHFFPCCSSTIPQLGAKVEGQGKREREEKQTVNDGLLVISTPAIGAMGHRHPDPQLLCGMWERVIPEACWLPSSSCLLGPVPSLALVSMECNRQEGLGPRTRSQTATRKDRKMEKGLSLPIPFRVAFFNKSFQN